MSKDRSSQYTCDPKVRRATDDPKVRLKRRKSKNMQNYTERTYSLFSAFSILDHNWFLQKIIQNDKYKYVQACKIKICRKPLISTTIKFLFQWNLKLSN